MRTPALCLVVFLSLVVFFGNSSATTWFVNPDQTGDAPTIQAAIDSAAPGDTVMLANGTYTGDGNRDIIYGGSVIVIRSESGDPDSCVIDCEGTSEERHRGFEFYFVEEGRVVLMGLTVRNGYAPGNPPFPQKQGPVVVTPEDVSSRVCQTKRDRWEKFVSRTKRSDHTSLQTFETEDLGETFPYIQSTSTSRGSRLRDMARELITRRTFATEEVIDCTKGGVRDSKSDAATNAASYGGAILCVGDWPTTFEIDVSNCRFVDNSAGVGGGLFISNGELTATDCTFSGNSKHGLAGQLETTLNLANSYFLDNSGSGVDFDEVHPGGGSITSTHCGFSGNSDYGVRCYAMPASFARCEFSSNSYGFVCDWSDAIFEDCTFSKNRGGGVIAQFVSHVWATRCRSFDNIGEGMVVVEGYADLSECTFSNNTDGGLMCWWALVTAMDCTFSRNKSEHGDRGGGVDIDGLNWMSDVTFDGCDFVENSADWGAGMRIVDYTLVEVVDCRFVNNRATRGGAVYADGGWYLDVSLTGCTLSGNRATAGGGVYSVSRGNSGDLFSLVMSKSTLYGNSAIEGSAVFSVGHVSPTLENSIIAFGKKGEAIYRDQTIGPSTNLICCNVFGNGGGDWVGGIADQYGMSGNISEDPLFCDVSKGDFTIAEDSPCAPINSLGCGLIGALGVGCASRPHCPPDTLLNPGQQHQLEFVVRNRGFVSDWFVYSIEGDSLMFCQDDIITTWESTIENTVFLDPGGHSTIRMWTRVDTLASPGDTLSIDFDVVASNNPALIDSCDVNVIVGNTITAVGIDTGPSGVSLNQNVPNPFNPTTRIDFTVDTNGPVSLRVFDISGRLVRTLVRGRRTGLWHTEEWDGRDDMGNQVPSGVYFYQLSVGDKTLTRKAVLVR